MSKASTLIFIALIITQSSQVRDWRGLAPLRSARVDVERLLGQPLQNSGSVYQTAGETISVSYSERPCDYGWQVPVGTVISFSVQSKKPAPFASLKLDGRKYEKRRDPHIESLYYYVNQEEGLNYTVDAAQGVVLGLELYPAAKEKTRRCSSQTTIKPDEVQTIKDRGKKRGRGHKR
jgi:hypothetical protein